jgi:hypothetical protein
MAEMAQDLLQTRFFHSVLVLHLSAVMLTFMGGVFGGNVS